MSPTQQRQSSKSSGEASGPETPLLSLNSAIFRDVKVALKVTLGEFTLSIDELLALKSGSVVKLDRMMSEPVDLHLNGALIARGEIVAVDDNFGVRIVEIASAP